MHERAKLLTPAHNFAVVQLPERKFPGVVFQGDSLHSIVTQIANMQKLLATGQLEDLSEEFEFLLKDLFDIQADYEQVCSTQGIGLPYVR
ncbi:hypothetical protein [Rhizobium sp. S96]|uniref:DUF6959 family protein n=1 Tax=Rhizobium sp. S96 TaxID=3055140 RepID=UPI0025AA3C55|nr:hypothetical protein [Rhizobium sp. S96]MDM9622451.1 hypothetical protein [Rhizobium sp. S96]